MYRVFFIHSPVDRLLAVSGFLLLWREHQWIWLRAQETEKSLELRLGLCAPGTAGVAEIQEGLLWLFLLFFGRCGSGVSSLHCSQFVKQGLRNPSDSPTRPVWVCICNPFAFKTILQRRHVTRSQAGSCSWSRRKHGLELWVPVWAIIKATEIPYCGFPTLGSPVLLLLSFHMHMHDYINSRSYKWEKLRVLGFSETGLAYLI